MAASMKTGEGVFYGVVDLNQNNNVRVAGIAVQLSPSSKPGSKSQAATGGSGGTRTTLTDSEGRFEFRHVAAPGSYTLQADASGLSSFGVKSTPQNASVEPDQATEVNLELQTASIHLSLRKREKNEANAETLCHAVVGEPVVAYLSKPEEMDVTWTAPAEASAFECEDGLELQFRRPGTFFVGAQIISPAATSQAAGSAGQTPPPPSTLRLAMQLSSTEAPARRITGDLQVSLQRPASERTNDEILWIVIRNRTHAISFERYRRFLNRVLLWEENQKLPEPLERRLRDLGAHLHGTGAYQVLKLATEIFLLLECGVRIDRDGQREFENRSQAGISDSLRNDSGELAERLAQYLGCPPQLPYIRRVVEAAFPQYELSITSGSRLLVDKINEPCLLELIWSYWHEEGMLMQTMNAISRRFQNVRRGERDPLLNLEIDPLRPANNLLWGYVQDEPNRLSVARRASEYMHEYGLSLYGKALHHVHSADTRSKFLEAFHNLLYQASVFYKEDAQTTVIADGYPLLNALKDVHLILAQGAHNQFGDMPWTARAEMLLVQFILARPEIRDFLQSRAMVPYKEPWMPQVDAMKTMQGWTDVTVTHFRDLAVYGEQLLLSVRYGDWTNVDNEDSAKNWARFHKEAIYAYNNANRIATGVDLTNPDTVDATVPAVLLQRRLAQQHQRIR
jgi:hypothetical protein